MGSKVDGWLESSKVWLYRHFFTNLSGICMKDWLRLLRENRFRVSPRYWPRALFVSLVSSANSVGAWREDRRFRAAIERTCVEKPLFILGHWRSGTTHLHNLFALDRRFGWPTTYQSFYPRTFLLTEASASRRYGVFMPRNRIVDNLAASFAAPMEDEFAIAVLTGLSPYLGWSFPAREDHYDRYLTFEEATDSERIRWKQGLQYFLQKLTFHTQRPLVLKSPAHTSRIRWILEIFPDARFLHIRRHPYAVYPSMKRLILQGIDGLRLQKPSLVDLHERILRRYRQMYDTYFATKELIPPGQLFEMSLEELESDGLATMERAYRALDLPDFVGVEAELKRHLESLKSYQKNDFGALPPAICKDIDREWGPSFAAWDYSHG